MSTLPCLEEAALITTLPASGPWDSRDRQDPWQAEIRPFQLWNGPDWFYYRCYLIFISCYSFLKAFCRCTNKLCQELLSSLHLLSRNGVFHACSMDTPTQWSLATKLLLSQVS